MNWPSTDFAFGGIKTPMSTSKILAEGFSKLPKLALLAFSIC